MDVKTDSRANPDAPANEVNASVAQTGSSRRAFLNGLGQWMGGITAGALLSAQGISTAMAYTPKADSEKRDGQIFKRHEMALLKQISGLIIPATDTPSAADLDAHGFIDNQLFYCGETKDKERAHALLKRVEAVSVDRHLRDFNQLNNAQQLDLLTTLERGESPFHEGDRWDFKLIKSLVVFSFYTSEVGSTKELRYQPVPGGFKGSIPHKKTDLGWAT